MKRMIISFLIFSAVYSICYSQHQWFKVLDAETAKPIPFANVKFANNLSGTSTDLSGIFVIPEQLKGIINISSIGFIPLEINLDTINHSGTEIIPLYLEPYVYGLDEYSFERSVPLKNPREIVELAIEKIPDNYCRETMVIKGYYQDVYQDYNDLKTEDIISRKVSVEVPGWLDTSMTINCNKMSHKIDSDFWLNFRYNDKAFLPQYHIPDYGNSHLKFLLNMDPIKNHNRPSFDFIKRLDKDFLKNHWFRLKGIEKYNNRNTYVIYIALDYGLVYDFVNYFEPYYEWRWRYLYPAIGKGRMCDFDIGMIYIDVEDLAIVMFDYYNGFLNDRYKCTVEYVKQGDRYFLSKLYFGNKFRMNSTEYTNAVGVNDEGGLWCDKAEDYYKTVVEQARNCGFSKTQIKEVVKQNTISCPNSSLPAGGGSNRWITRIIAYNKATEDLLDSTVLKHYGKYLHHRFLRVNTISTKSDDKSDSHFMPLYTDFNRHFHFIGDVEFDWYTGFNWEEDRVAPVSILKVHNQIRTGRGAAKRITAKYYPWAPLPITSIDELRYIDSLSLMKLEYLTPEYKLIKGRLLLEDFDVFPSYFEKYKYE